MNKGLLTKNAILLLVFILSSCNANDIFQGEKQNQPILPSEVFDFNLMQEIKLDIDYGLANDYYVIFELYARNPMKEGEDIWEKDSELSPVYAASTQKGGIYSGSITIPSDITELWLYCDYPGAVSPVKLTVTAGKVSFNQAAYISSAKARTRGTTAGGYKYLDDWMTMPGVDWDKYGLPTNIEPELSMPAADILYSIKETYSKVRGKRIIDIHKDWTEDSRASEIKIIKDTELSLVFISSGAGWNNSIGYFTYPTNSIPTESNIQKVLAFPNASPISKESGKLLCGHEVKLKYWNKDTKQFEDKFPAGTTVGWCLQGMGFKGVDSKDTKVIGNIEKGMGTRYSYSDMNSEKLKIQHVVALRYQKTNQTVAIGFEDNNDQDYCDAVFYLKVAEPNAIEPDGPELPSVNPPSNVEHTVEGTLTYEDQWPSLGDYDMNDAVIKYQSTIYRNVLNNKVYKIVDKFTPVHNGGSKICGFGYQLSQLPSEGVRNITVSGPEGWEIEQEQSHPTVILFDNIKQVLNKVYTVTIQLNDVEEKLVSPPYNPFIFVDDRGTEVHLVNYTPTGKANFELFDTKDDLSNIAAGVYYISRYDEGEVDLMPFGINIPSLDFGIPDERVKIYDTYPDFIKWVKSKGKSNSDWYKKKKG